MTSQIPVGCVQQKGRFAIVEITNTNDDNRIESEFTEKKKKKKKQSESKHLINHFQRNITEEESINFDIYCEVFDYQSRRWVDFNNFNTNTTLFPKNNKTRHRAQEEIESMEIYSCEYSSILAHTDDHHTDNCFMTDENKVKDDHENKCILNFNPLSNVNNINNMINSTIQTKINTVKDKDNKDQNVVQLHNSKICEKDTTVDSNNRSQINNIVVNSNYKSYSNNCAKVLSISNSKSKEDLVIGIDIAQYDNPENQLTNEVSIPQRLKSFETSKISNISIIKPNQINLSQVDIEAKTNTKERNSDKKNYLSLLDGKYFKEYSVSPKYKTSSGDWNYKDLDMSLNIENDDFNVFDYKDNKGNKDNNKDNNKNNNKESKDNNKESNKETKEEKPKIKSTTDIRSNSRENTRKNPRLYTKENRKEYPRENPRESLKENTIKIYKKTRNQRIHSESLHSAHYSSRKKYKLKISRVESVFLSKKIDDKVDKEFIYKKAIGFFHLDIVNEININFLKQETKCNECENPIINWITK